MLEIIGMLTVSYWITRIVISIVDTYQERKEVKRTEELIDRAEKTLARMQAKLDERNKKDV